MTEQVELTNPAQELYETCTFLNKAGNPSNETTLTFLQRQLNCENNTPLFFTVLAALDRRFDLVGDCIRRTTSLPETMREDALRRLSTIRNAIHPGSFNQTWDGIRGGAFTDSSRTALLYLGPALQSHFPLRRLSPDERKSLLRHTRSALEAAEGMASESIFGAMAVTSLRSVLVILERLECFGVNALTEATINSYSRIAAAAREAEHRQESAKILRRLKHAAQVLLMIHGAVAFVNDGWTTYEELWGRANLVTSWITSQSNNQKALPPPVPSITFQPSTGSNQDDRQPPGK